MNNLDKAKKLLSERNRLRKAKNFEESDRLRNEIEALGFVVIDEKETSFLQLKETEDKPKKSFLVLFGSGESSPSGRRIHEYVFQHLAKPEISIGIISSPAGFQTNVKTVHEEVVDFFREHLTNFHPKISIIYANSHEDANNPEIVNMLDGVDYFFIGPGSPTYTIKTLKDSLLYQRLCEKVRAGASLCLASAAAIAFYHFALPVYEIYKVGEDLHWREGLNFYSLMGYENITIIPHFNNTEGGKKLDTSYCYMGEERFKKLRALLPENEAVWGIDEQTAVVIDLKTKEEKVLGNGSSHQI